MTAFLILAAAGCAGCAGHSDPDWIESLGYQQDEIFPMDVGKYGFPYVPVRINGVELELAFDTGNMSELLIGPGTAEVLALPVVGESQHYDSAGNVIGTFPIYGVDRLELLGESWEDLRASRASQDDLPGLVGPRFVLGRRLTLDYENGLVAISGSGLAGAARHGDVLPMVLSPDHEGLVIVRGTVNGRETLFEIDTGKSRTTVDPALAAELSLPDVARGYLIDEVKLGRRTFSVPSAKAVSLGGISQGLPEPILLGIGSDILSQVVFTIDYLRSVVLIGN